MPTLYTADRCPYAARARIVLAEKGIAYEAVEIDLDDRPAWIYEKNATGRVPVYEEDEGLVLPESEVIMEYLEERYPEPALWPADPAERALGRLWLNRFDDRLGGAYYAARRGDEARAELDAAARRARRRARGAALPERPRVRSRRHRLRPLDPARARPLRPRARPGDGGLARALLRAARGRGRASRRLGSVKVVLLHAYPLDERMWEPQLEALRDYEVVTPRLYGRGRTVDEYAASVLAEADGELALVGASLGGYTALAMAHLEPVRIRALALIDARVDADSPERRAGRAVTKSADRGGRGASVCGRTSGRSCSSKGPPRTQ